MRKFILCAAVLCAVYNLPALAVPAESTPVEGANIAVAYQLPNSEKVYGQNFDTYYHPASTQKLLTGLSAILYLGHQWKMKTELKVSDSAFNAKGLNVDKNGILRGDVLLRFTGDPTFDTKKFHTLVQSLEKAGVKHIKGSVILDVSRFGGKSRGNGWSWDDLPICFTAPAAPIIINRNCVFAQLQPHGEGSVATPVISGGSPIGITSDAVAVKPANYGGDCELEANMYIDNKYHITGCVPIQEKNKPWPLSLSVADPEAWGTDWTAMIMSSHNITYDQIKIARKALSGFTTISTVESAPLGELVKYMLYKSNNLYADAIAKNLAAEYYGLPATYYRATKAIISILKKYASVDLGNAYLVDGSGLSPHNLITPHQMLNLLDFINKNDNKVQFVKLMPVADESGTLKWRGSVREAPLAKNVTAKTGALQNVSNLAGLVTTRSGVRVPFVVFSNSLSYPEKIRDQVRFHRIAQPSLKYERYVLENIYNEKVMGRDF
ncbi:MAG: D-alanyl-D-alanine carboxypeptidase/D-alanyl-D-alanine-endopeptidase [Succinivibrio sp.]|nr:D-alanyl-D-alanine carboxypeptidase/D-alanyl-D-alanine-endopeptidase [Succinivibrio sp.]